MEGKPFAGLMEVNPFAGLMEAKPFAGLMEANPFAGLMEAKLFAGLMEANPFVGLIEAKPFAGLMEATTFLTATLSSLFDPHRFQATSFAINFHNIISQNGRSDLPGGLPETPVNASIHDQSTCL